MATKEQSKKYAEAVGSALHHIGEIPIQEDEHREARLQNCVTVLENIQQEFKNEAEGD